MFNTYISKSYSSPSVKTDVHVHRAPTDESVRLLKEMEAIAVAKNPPKI